MLKIASLLSKYQSVVLVILLAPLLGLFFKMQLEMIPENPHLHFQVEFKAPARPASEILSKVTEPVEKIFNGLPHLIGINSRTLSEKAIIDLRFKESAKENTTYLNIQEKMDRIKLLLPRDVSSYQVTQLKQIRPADIHIHFPSPVSLSEIQEALRTKASLITQSNPSLDKKVSVIISPKPIQMAKFDLSLSNIVNALKTLGISTTLGRRNGILFETGLNFLDLSEVRSALVGAKGHRPLRLEEVANIELTAIPKLTELSLWFDDSRTTKSAMETLLSQAFPNSKFEYPRWHAILEQSLQPLFFLFIIVTLQFLTIYFLKIPWRFFIFFGFFNATTAVHFLFWKGLLAPPLTVLDLHALVFTLLIGSIFLAVLAIRIRSHFMEFKAIKKPPKTLEQAKLFSLAELVPTFITLVIAAWIISLPTLTTAINLPSRAILTSLFYVGFPALFFMLAVLPLSIKGDFFQKNISFKKARFKWSLNPVQAQWATWALAVFSLASIVLFSYFNVGVKDFPDSTSQGMVTQYRGYKNQLEFKSDSLEPLNLEQKNFVIVDKNKKTAVKLFEFSNSGKRFLDGLDLGGFANSLLEVQSDKVIGYVESQRKIPLIFSAKRILSGDVPELLLSAKDKSENPKTLRALSQVQTTSMKTQILRDNMFSSDRYVVKNQSKGSFLTTPPSPLVPTAWTGYLLSQFERFKEFHLVSFVFLFFLFAIYLNSFVRSILLLLFSLSITSFLFLINLFFKVPFHADSLWLLYMGVFIALFQILVYTRIIDIERSRGYDRNLSIEEVRTHLAPGVYICSWIFVFALVISGLTEKFSFLPSLGFWSEATYVGLLTAIFLPVSTHFLFPLFYLTSEEAINKLAFRVYRLAMIWKKK